MGNGGAKPSRRGRPLLLKRKSRRRRSSHGQGQEVVRDIRGGLDQEIKTAEAGAEAGARGKSRGGQEVDRQVGKSRRGLEVGREVRGGRTDQGVAAREGQEGRGASQEVGLEGREADQKVDQKRNRNENHEVVRVVDQRRNLRKLVDQDPLRRPRLILQHPEARKRKRRSRGQGALRKGRGGRNEQLQP